MLSLHAMLECQLCCKLAAAEHGIYGSSFHAESCGVSSACIWSPLIAVCDITCMKHSGWSTTIVATGPIMG